MRPRLLDLFCGAGGCTKGYQRAGFQVVGVDIEPQPRYCGDLFIRGDALEALEDGFWVLGGIDSFDAVHASPPCQAFTTMSNRWRDQGTAADGHLNLIAATRELLQATGLPYVIENVLGARSELRTPVLLNGGMFGMNVHRPRLFETSWPMLVPRHVPVLDPIGVYGEKPDGRWLNSRNDGSRQYAASSIEQAAAAMEIDWMEWREIAEAIPPVYTELIGHQLMSHIRAVAA